MRGCPIELCSERVYFIKCGSVRNHGKQFIKCGTADRRLCLEHRRRFSGHLHLPLPGAGFRQRRDRQHGAVRFPSLQPALGRMFEISARHSLLRARYLCRGPDPSKPSGGAAALVAPVGDSAGVPLSRAGLLHSGRRVRFSGERGDLLRLRASGADLSAGEGIAVRLDHVHRESAQRHRRSVPLGV